MRKIELAGYTKKNYKTSRATKTKHERTSERIKRLIGLTNYKINYF